MARTEKAQLDSVCLWTDSYTPLGMRHVMETKSTPEESKARQEESTDVYVCSTCGKATENRTHLCSPVKADQVYVCQDCGASASDPQHVCTPVTAEMKYRCEQCDRVTAFEEAVCQPKLMG